MILYVIFTEQGGGFPVWNIGCTPSWDFQLIQATSYCSLCAAGILLPTFPYHLRAKNESNTF